VPAVMRECAALVRRMKSRERLSFWMPTRAPITLVASALRSEVATPKYRWNDEAETDPGAVLAGPMPAPRVVQTEKGVDPESATLRRWFGLMAELPSAMVLNMTSGSVVALRMGPSANWVPQMLWNW